MYIYEGHMGGLYTSDEPLDYEDLYCEECGDSDWLIGYAETREDAWNLSSLVTDLHITQIVNGIRGCHVILPHGKLHVNR